MKLSASRRLSLRPIDDEIWHRAIPQRYWSNALRTDHTRKVTSRFSAGTSAKPSYRILYLAQSPVVAAYEVRAVLGLPGQHVTNPGGDDFRYFGVTVRLQSVADLTNPTEQHLLGISAQELTGSWDIYPPGLAPTQLLGAALHDTQNIEGFLTYAAALPTHKTLIVFPKKMLPGSRIHFHDAILGKTHQIRPRSRL